MVIEYLEHFEPPLFRERFKKRCAIGTARVTCIVEFVFEQRYASERSSMNRSGHSNENATKSAPRRIQIFELRAFSQWRAFSKRVPPISCACSSVVVFLAPKSRRLVDIVLRTTLFNHRGSLTCSLQRHTLVVFERRYINERHNPL